MVNIQFKELFMGWYNDGHITFCVDHKLFTTQFVSDKETTSELGAAANSCQVYY